MEVIFVDDQKDLHALFSFMFDKRFEELGWTHRCFDRPETCLDYMASDLRGEASENYLLITDLNMPGMTGLELSEKIKDLRPQDQVWMLSAFNTKEFIERAEEIDPEEEYLAKPVNFTGLLDMLGQHFDLTGQMAS